MNNRRRVDILVLFIAICAILINVGLWSSPKPTLAGSYDSYVYQYLAPQNIPAGSNDLKTKLEAEVNKVISDGHLAPFRALYGEGYGTTGQYYWYHPYDTIYTLSLAYPYVSATTQASIKTYLQSEMSTYPAWSPSYLDPNTGFLREPDILTAAERGSIPSVYSTRPKLFALYALWLYAQNTGDWNYINTNWNSIKSFYTANEAETGKFYTSIAGAIGMARMAHQKPTPDSAMETTALNDVNNGMANGTVLSTFGDNSTTAYQYNSGENWTYTLSGTYQGFQFLDISPEIGKYIADNPTLASAAIGSSSSDTYSITHAEYQFPLWYMAEEPADTISYGEGNSIPPDVKAEVFPIENWVKKDSAATLRNYLDVPDSLVGDYYWMQNVVRTIEASGTTCWTDIRTNTSTCPSASPTPTLTPTPTPTATPTPTTTPTATPTPTPSPTPTCTSNCSGTVTTTIASSTDDVNEDGTTFDSSNTNLWLGTGASTTSSYTGLRFANVAIPQGATITSAKLTVNSAQSQWNSYSFTYQAEATGNSVTFSATNKPSQRTWGTQSVTHNDDVQWQVGTNYTLDEIAPVIQEVVSRPDWASGNSLSLILKGTGGAYARKFIQSYDGSPTSAPQLVITYSGASGGASPTPTPTPTYTVSGNVYIDANGNGVKDTGETGYQGATVTVSGAASKSTTTDASGNYTITGLAAATYQVALTVPSGYQATTASSVSLPLAANTTQNFGIKLSTASPTPTPTGLPVTTIAFNTTKAGAVDDLPRQLVRTNSDLLYLFGGKAQSSTTIEAYWTGAGLPNGAASFTGNTSVNDTAQIITTEAAYDGGSIVHVIILNTNGEVKDYPFDLTTNTFKNGITLSTGNPNVFNIGTQGVSAMVDTAGKLNVAHWSANNHITYRQYSYTASSDALTLTEGPTQVDTTGSSNHPELVVSPADGLVTVAWISQATTPAQVLTRTRTAANTWGSIQTASTGNVWTSTNSGINIDQGPSMIVSADGTKRLVYIENYDSTNDYGRVHYVTEVPGVTSWTDTSTAFYTHAPAIATDTAGDLYIVGHGHPNNVSCTSELDMCYIKYTGSGWSNPQLLLAHTGSDSLDSSVSVKWGVVGWNRPETVELLFFAAVNGDYNNTQIYYGRFGSATPSSTPTATPSPTPVASYTLTGTVFNDANKNGFQDTGENGYAGATVSLSTGQTAITNSSGSYSLANLTAGTYMVSLTVPTGYATTTTNPVSVALGANTTQNFGLAATSSASADWPQVQHDAQHSGYIPDTFGPPYTQLWRKDGSTSPAMPPVSSRVQPVVAYNLVYIPSDNGALYAFKASDGTEAWHYQTGGALVNAAAVDDSQGIVYVGSTDHTVYALDAQTGALKWTYTTGGTIRTAPVLANGTVYIAGSDAKVYALNGATGTMIWQQAVDKPVLETPAYYNGNVYVGTISTKAYALNGTTGAVVWSKQLNGQGFRDRWITAGNGKVFFNPVPNKGNTMTLNDGESLLTGIYTSTWASQRSSILNYLSQTPFDVADNILDPATGNVLVPPILYSNGGSSSEEVQPVVLPNGNFNVIYRYTEGQPNPGCGTTCNFWDMYLGEYNPGTNDITQLDHWGSGTSMDTTTKIPFISDESSALVRSGNIIYIDSSRGTAGFDTTTGKVIPFTSYNSSSGGIYYSPPIVFYPPISGDGWATQYPGAEMDSDGNDWKRPTPIAGGVFYLLHDSTLIAVRGTQQ